MFFGGIPCPTWDSSWDTSLFMMGVGQDRKESQQELAGAGIIIKIDQFNIYKNVCCVVCGLWIDKNRMGGESFYRD